MKNPGLRGHSGRKDEPLGWRAVESDLPRARDDEARQIMVPGNARQLARGGGSASSPGQRARTGVQVEFDDFGWEAIEEEARRQGVSIEELLVHAVMYYLAEASTSNRFAVRAPRLTVPAVAERTAASD